DDRYDAFGSLEAGFKDSGFAAVLPGKTDYGICRLDRPAPVPAIAEERRKDRLRVKPRQAKPVYRTGLRYQRRGIGGADDAVVFDADAHRRPSAPTGSSGVGSPPSFLGSHSLRTCSSTGRPVSVTAGCFRGSGRDGSGAGLSAMWRGSFRSLTESRRSIFSSV